MSYILYTLILPGLFGKKPAFLAIHQLSVSLPTPTYSLLTPLPSHQTTDCLVSPECAWMQERQLTLLRNVQVLSPGSEECCVLVIQATIREKCTRMFLFGPSLTEIVEVVQKMKQIR